MSWGGSAKQDSTDVELAGIEDETISTSQEAIPLPYVAGERKVAARWLSNVYNQRAEEIPMDAGKKGSSTGSGSYEYYGSIAALVCCGTADELVSIIVDTEQVWALGNVTRSASADQPYHGTIADKGEFVFYWGTETQTLEADSILRAENNGLGEAHPDYKGIAFIEFHSLLFGKEKVTAPNVEIVVNRRPVQNLITSTPSELVDDQANLLCAVAELLTNHRFGIRLPDSMFDSSTFQTVAATLYSRNELAYASPLLNQQDSMRAFLANVGLMTDTFLLWDSTGGLIECGYWPHGETIDPDTLPVITMADLTDSPDLDAESWTGMETGWAITFPDRDRVYKESSGKFDDISLIEVTGEPNRATLKRPYVTRRTQALAYATEWGKTRARPGLTGRISVRKTRIGNLNVGNFFRLDIEPEPGGAQLQQVCRITEITAQKTGSADITIEAETNLAPIGHTPVIPGQSDGGGSIAEPEPLAFVRPVELPPKLSAVDYGIAVLTQRADTMTIGFNLHYDDASDGSFCNIGNQRAFNVRCLLASDFAATAKGADEAGYADADGPIFDTTLANDIDLLNLSDDLGLTVARNNQMLVFLLQIEDTGERSGQIKLDASGYPMIEILSLSTMVAVGTGLRRIEALRGRFGTVRRSFSAGAEAWFVYRDTLKVYDHKDFPIAAAAQTPCYFKTEPYNAFLSRDISGDSSVNFLFPSARLFAPQISLTTTPTSGYVGVAVSVEGVITDQDADLSYWSVAYRNAGTGVQDEVSVAGGPIETTDRHEFKVPLRFVESGTYVVYVRAKDNTTFINSYVETSFQIAVTVVGELNPPAAPSAMTAETGFLMVWLEWVNPADDDIDHLEIWAAETNNLAAAEKLIETKAAFYAHNVTTADTHYYWTRAVDTSGNVGPYNAGQYEGTAGAARVLIAGDDVGQNEIIAFAANIANGIITNAKIANLTVDKLQGGTIGAIDMVLAANGTFKSANYDEGTAGLMFNGDGSAEFNDVIIRNGTMTGGSSRSLNQVDGVAGAKINWDTGAAEFWDVNIYGTVQMPQVFINSIELPSGSEFPCVGSVTITISTLAGTSAFYRTDGTAPSGLVGEAVPVGGMITFASLAELRIVAYEDKTSRSSETYTARIMVSQPVIVNNCMGNGMYIRTFEASAPAMCVRWKDGLNTTQTESLPVHDAYDSNGLPFGYKYGPWLPDSIETFPVITFWFGTEAERIGFFYTQSEQTVDPSTKQLRANIYGAPLNVYSGSFADPTLEGSSTLAPGLFYDDQYQDVWG